MRIVKYEKEACANCRQVDRYCSSKGYKFDEVIDAITGITPQERLKLQIRMAPTIIAFDDNGNEIERLFGPDLKGLDRLFEMRGR